MNKVILMGRIAQDIDVKTTASGNAVLSFSIAVDRGYAKPGEERQTDFITCVAWKSVAEFIGKHFAKGRMIAVEGELRTRSYDDKNGVKHYVTEVLVSRVYFTGEKKLDTTEATPKTTEAPAESGASEIPIPNLSDFEVDPDDVPF